MLKSTVQSYEDYLIPQGVGIKKARPVKGRAKCLKVNWSKNLSAKVCSQNYFLRIKKAARPGNPNPKAAKHKTREWSTFARVQRLGVSRRSALGNPAVWQRYGLL